MIQPLGNGLQGGAAVFVVKDQMIAVGEEDFRFIARIEFRKEGFNPLP
jgi:hypothetical protein